MVSRLCSGQIGEAFAAANHYFFGAGMPGTGSQECALLVVYVP